LSTPPLGLDTNTDDLKSRIRTQIVRIHNAGGNSLSELQSLSLTYVFLQEPSRFYLALNLQYGCPHLVVVFIVAAKHDETAPGD
jgi:hypothetical protein